MKIVAKALVYDASGNILVLRRSATHPRFAHHLDFPGGEVDEGENIQQAVVREIAEETGLTVAIHEVELLYSKQASAETQHVLFAARTAGQRPQATVSREHDRFDWLIPSELLQKPIPQGVDSYYLTVLEYLRGMEA